MPPKTQNNLTKQILLAVFVVLGFVALLSFWGEFNEPSQLDSQFERNNQEAQQSLDRIEEAKRKAKEAREARERKQP